MQAADVIWGGLLAVCAGVEAWAVSNGKPGDTLSERIRAWFQVKSQAGRITFAVVWLGFASWFLVHILS
jgi:hypothetical protein